MFSRVIGSAITGVRGGGGRREHPDVPSDCGHRHELLGHSQNLRLLAPSLEYVVLLLESKSDPTAFGELALKLVDVVRKKVDVPTPWPWRACDFG